MSNTNHQIAAMFHRMSQVLDILGEDSFRASAFSRAGRALEDHSQDVSTIGPDPAKLTEIPGIGKGMAQRIAEVLKTGKLADYDKLMQKIPPGLLELLNVQGLGPKTIALLWNEAGVTSVAELRKKCETPESLKGIKGLGPKKIENLKKNLEMLPKEGEHPRVRIGDAMALAMWFVRELREQPQVKQITYAGSLRRGRETVGDIDLIAAVSGTKGAKALGEAMVKLELVGDVLGQGPTKTSVRTHEGVQVDLRVVEPSSMGAALLYFTGSKQHNVRLRERAIRMGMKLNEYGLFKNDDESMVAGETEQDVYAALKLKWIPPELREDRGEIEQAEKDTLPKLIELADVKAELHAHTTASDGKWSIRELVTAAIERGMHTVAITDHSVSQTIAHGLSAQRLEAHIKDVHAVADEFKKQIRVLAGSEVDILADGKLDYPNSILKQLDLVVASPHAALTQDSAKATERLLRAIDNPYITILGHPTGRIINRRQGLTPDMGKLIKAAAKRGIAMEINANYYRLDLRDTHARAALDAGVKLAINTDAHGPADLEQLRFGILTARRAGATAEDVINCMSQSQLSKWIASTRS